MICQPIKIIATGKYVPPLVVTDRELENKLALPEGWIGKKTGVYKRHYAAGESQSEMAAKAIRMALANANLTMDDIDCLVGANGVMEQAIPGNAVLTKKVLGADKAFPAFDIGATCLSFVVALDLVSKMIASGQYHRVIIFSSDIASIGLDWSHKESSVLFGDAAGAVIVEKDSDINGAKILSSGMETYIEGADMAEVKGGGTKILKKPYHDINRSDYLFHMEGEKLFKLSMKYVPDLFEKLLFMAKCQVKDIDLLIPHQASLTAMRLLQRNLGVADERFMVTIGEYGNTIASSIPLALHEAIIGGRIKRGDKVMLFGTSAGLSIGGMILVY